MLRSLLAVVLSLLFVPNQVACQLGSLRLESSAEIGRRDVPDGALILPSGEALYWRGGTVFHERWDSAGVTSTELASPVIGAGLSDQFVLVLVRSGQELRANIRSPLEFQTSRNVKLPTSVRSAVHKGGTWWATLEGERSTHIVELHPRRRVVLELPVVQTRVVSRPLVKLSLGEGTEVLASRTAYPFDTWRIDRDPPVRLGSVDTLLLRRPSAVAPLWALTWVTVIDGVQIRMLADLRSDLRLLNASDGRNCSLNSISAPLGFLAISNRRVLALRGGPEPRLLLFSWTPVNTSEVSKC